METRTTTFQQPVIPDVACAALSDRHRFASGDNSAYTSAWLEANWGKTASVTHIGPADEIWTYRLRTIWEGVMPVVLIPIPIALPVGREQVQFALHEGRVVRATQRTGHIAGGAVGFRPGPCTTTFGPFPLEELF